MPIPAFWWMIALVVTSSMAFVSVVVWVEGRRKEREDQYRNDIAHKIAEADDPTPILEYLRENERVDIARARLKATVAGYITFAVGVGLTIFLYQLAPGTAAYLAGLIPFLVGVSLLAVSRFVMKPAG